jgi:membrane associated rhomboid family serine protease
MASWSLSRKIFIGIIALFILSLTPLIGMITPYVALIPADVIPNFEFWRLLSYPLAADMAVGFMGLLVGSIAFGTPGEEIEQMLGTRQYGLLLLLVVLTAGLMHTALFFGASGPAMGGLANPALFIFVGFVYLFPHSDVRLFFFSIRSGLVLGAMAGVLMLLTIFNVSQSGMSPWVFFSNGGFGLLLGAVYFHLRFQKYPFLLRPIRSMERMTGRGKQVPVAHKPMASPRRASVSQPVRVRIPFQKAPVREMTDEERLNVILDKISEKSYNALTDDEKRFLSDYSGRL